MFSINAKLNSKSIAYVGRNTEDLIKQLESAVNDLGYTNFELIEKNKIKKKPRYWGFFYRLLISG